MIVRLGLINRHVDLAHIQTVGPAYFNNLMGSGGWFVGFSIDFMLQDKPRHYEWRAEEFGDTVKFEEDCHWIQYEDGTWTNNPGNGERHKEHGKLMCLKILDERIERDIVGPWKEWKDFGGAPRSN